jgi:outer membrane protein assembly factor BamB
MQPLRRPGIRLRQTVVGFMALLLTCHSSLGDDWPQWFGPRRDGVWYETETLREFPDGGPRVLWRKPIRGGYAGPAVARGRLFVMDRIVDPELEPKASQAMVRIPGQERILCLDSHTGDKLWEHTYECEYNISYGLGPRTTPLVDADRVYTLGAMGHLMCFRCDSGELIWSKDLVKAYSIDRPPVWGYAAHPLLDGDQLICLVGGKSAGVVAFDKHSGAERWRSIDAKEIGYAPPVIYARGDRKELVIWHDVAIEGLEPETGRSIWRFPFPVDGQPQRPVVTIVTPRLFGDHLLVSDFYHGSVVLRFTAEPPDVEEVWVSPKGDGNHKDSLNSLMATAVVVDGHIYGMAGDGELRCLNAFTGELLWRDPTPTGDRPAYFATTFIIPNGNKYFLYTDQGELIIAELSPQGYRELDRAKLLETTSFARGREVVWSHPAFADRCLYARNDKEIICADLASPGAP